VTEKLTEKWGDRRMTGKAKAEEQLLLLLFIFLSPHFSVSFLLFLYPGAA
jgi:hypothetical protein